MVDIGFQRPALVKQVVSRFLTSIRSRLPLCDYLHLRLAEGMIAMAQEATDDAIHHLDFVLSLNQEIQEDKELLAIANFWKGRCLRMKGEYDDSLAFAIKGRDSRDRTRSRTNGRGYARPGKLAVFPKG